MSAENILRDSIAEPVAPWPRHVVSPAAWSELAGLASLDLLALWADTTRAHALFADSAGGVLPVATPVIDGAYPALSPQRPAAALFERMVHDLWGHVATDASDLRPWLDHGHWDHRTPMAQRPPPRAGAPEPPEFLPVSGEDLHQIGCGPVQGGLGEPAHIRVTAAGETVLRLEARLGYAHKGTLVMMRGKPPRVAARFAARLSGDSTVAHAWAYASAVEAALGVAAPPRALALRAVMAELERVANHLGDLAAIVGETALATVAARLGFLRETMLTAAAAAFGHRLMMDAVIPGGVAADIGEGGALQIRAALDLVAAETGALRRRCDGRAGLQDRLVGTGVLSPELAAAHAAGGFVGRASGRGSDARVMPGYPPYGGLDFSVPVLRAGDADARVRIRWAELAESTRLLRSLLATLPAGPLSVALPTGSGEGLGVAEGFRGDIWHWVRLDGGMIAAAFARDPSWLQWNLLEAVIAGGAVADVPLCIKSFNCACSAVDL